MYRVGEYHLAGSNCVAVLIDEKEENIHGHVYQPHDVAFLILVAVVESEERAMEKQKFGQTVVVAVVVVVVVVG